MRATLMYGAHDVRVETLPDARIVEPTGHGTCEFCRQGTPSTASSRRHGR